MPYESLPIDDLALRPSNDAAQYHESRSLNSQTNKATIPAHSQSNHHAESLQRNETVDMDMAAPMMAYSATQFHTDGNGLPFDNLDVQELWDWMGNLSEYDGYSYQGSY